jgi:hypothetical protein
VAAASVGVHRKPMPRGLADTSVDGERELHGWVRFVRVTGRHIGQMQRQPAVR